MPLDSSVESEVHVENQFLVHRAELGRVLSFPEDEITRIRDGVYREVEGTGMGDVITIVTDGEERPSQDDSDLEHVYDNATFGVAIRRSTRQIHSVKISPECPPIRVITEIARSGVRV